MKFRYTWPAILWFIITFILLTLPGSAFPQESMFSFIYLDKIVHMGIFGLFTLLLCWSFFRSRNGQVRFPLFLLLATVSLAYGAAMEFVQRDYVVNRDFDVYDIVADGVGAYLGAFLGWQWLKVWRETWLRNRKDSRG